jgi:prepilin peptidase CpaA
MLQLSVEMAYKALFLLCLPICLWVAWTDLKFMKIPNKAVIALLGVFFFGGLLVIPLDAWLWRWASFAGVLAIGFVLNAIANVGAGDAKFAAAAAPFVIQQPQHLQIVLILLAAFLLGAFFAHRGLRMVPLVRRMTPDWVSWTRKDFPMGLALVGTLMTYLGFVGFPSFYGWVTGAFASINM